VFLIINRLNNSSIFLSRRLIEFVKAHPKLRSVMIWRLLQQSGLSFPAIHSHRRCLCLLKTGRRLDIYIH
jgi:hypothetical protein